MSGRGSRAAWMAALLASSVSVGVLTAVTQAHAVVGDAAKDGQYAFTAKLNIGDKRTCTGALVDASWVLTAASCFADDPAQGFRITSGAPKMKTTVIVGRTDLTGNSGIVTEAVELSARGDRDLVMVRLAQPAVGVSPVRVATGAPAQGEELRVAGYGRTKDEWVPENLHSGTFGIGAVADSSLALTGTSGSAVCKGDTGAPAFREKDGKVELAAVATASWQGGCLGNEAETRTDASATRVDDVNSWIQQRRASWRQFELTSVVTTADFNGDGRTDLAAVMRDGSLVAFYAGPNGTLEYGRELWGDKTWGGKTEIIGGDFNGDGVADIAAIASDGSLSLYSGQANGKLATAKKMWGDNSWGKIPNVARYRGKGWTRDGLIAITGDQSLYAYPSGADGLLTGKKLEMWPDKSWKKAFLATGDFNGDGLDDIVAVSTDGALKLYRGNAVGKFDGAVSMSADSNWDTMQFFVAGDFTGDGKADIIARAARSIIADQPGSIRLHEGDGKGKVAAGHGAWPGSS